MQSLNMRFEHIGYAVKSITKAREFFELLGFTAVSEEITDEVQKSKIQFLSNGNLTIELIEPLSKDSPTVNILKKIGPTPYHLCFSTEEFESVYEKLKRSSILIMKRVPAKAFQGKEVAFFYNKEIGLLEVLDGGGNSK